MLIRLEDEFPGHANDLAWLDGLEKEFRKGWELEKATYKARQMAARMEIPDRIKNVDGLGQLKFVGDARTYFRWLQEDDGFWEDDGNVNKFLSDNPEWKAPAPEKKTMVVV